MPDRLPLRVALLGFGLGGRAFHAPLVATTPGLELAAVVTRDPERRAQAAQDHPDATLLDAAEDVWARADELDLVVVTTPNRSHVPLATAALEHGLPVVVDKPLAATAAEARGLADAARERGLALSPFHNRRWDGDALTLRALVDEGRLGDVWRLESRFERWRPTPKEGWRESADPADGGGQLLDLGPHLVDQALWLLGPAPLAHAEVRVRRAGVEADDDAFVALAHASGAISQLWMGATAARSGPRFRVLGSEAGYVKDGLDVQEAQLKAGTWPGAAGYGAEPEAAWGTLGADDDVAPVATRTGDYGAFYAQMAAAVRGEGPVPVEPADAVRVLELLDEARALSGLA